MVIQDVILLWYSLFCKMFSFHMNTSEQERRPQTACQKNTDAQRQMLQLCKAHLALGSILGHPAPCWSVSYIPLQGHSQPDSSKTSSWYTRTCQAKLYKASFKFISKVSHSSCCTSQIHSCQQHRFRNIYLSLWLAYISAFYYFFHTVFLPPLSLLKRNQPAEQLLVKNINLKGCWVSYLLAISN